MTDLWIECSGGSNVPETMVDNEAGAMNPASEFVP